MKFQLMRRPIELRSYLFVCLLLASALAAPDCSVRDQSAPRLLYASTIAGTAHEFGEPFGVAAKGDSIYISDGDKGVIWAINGSTASKFAGGLDTPSGI